MMEKVQKFVLQLTKQANSLKIIMIKSTLTESDKAHIDLKMIVEVPYLKKQQAV